MENNKVIIADLEFIVNKCRMMFEIKFVGILVIFNNFIKNFAKNWHSIFDILIYLIFL